MTQVYCAGCGKPMTAYEVEWYGCVCENCGVEPLCSACSLCEDCAEDEQGAWDNEMEEHDAESA